MPYNPINKPMNEFKDKYLARSQAYIAEVNKYLKRGATPKQAADYAWRAVNYGELVEDATIKSMIKAAVIGADVSASVVVGKFTPEFILDKWVDMDGVKLSKHLYQNAAVSKQIIANELQAQLKLGRSYKYAAQFMQDNTGQFTAKIPGYLDSLLDAGRKTLYDNPASFRELQNDIKNMRKQLARLSENGTTDRLKVNYSKLIDAVESGNAAAIEKRLERAVMEKARYQAERLARTETARAYGDAKTNDIQHDEDATGMLWVLSSAHHKYDICDFNATADLYGMGPGVSPKDKGPEYPAHPGCTCILRPFYKDVKASNRVSSEAAIKHISGLSAEKRKSLLGATGSDNFKDNPKAWRSQLNHFSHVEKKPHIKL